MAEPKSSLERFGHLRHSSRAHLRRPPALPTFASHKKRTATSPTNLGLGPQVRRLMPLCSLAAMKSKGQLGTTASEGLDTASRILRCSCRASRFAEAPLASSGSTASSVSGSSDGIWKDGPALYGGARSDAAEIVAPEVVAGLRETVPVKRSFGWLAALEPGL